MTIKFQAPAGEVHEGVIDDIKKKLTELHHKDKEILQALVNFSKRPVAFDGDYVCEIELTIYGNSILVQGSGDSYLQASRMVMTELTQKVDEQLLKQKEPPKDIVSTVDV